MSLPYAGRCHLAGRISSGQTLIESVGYLRDLKAQAHEHEWTEICGYEQSIERQLRAIVDGNQRKLNGKKA